MLMLHNTDTGPIICSASQLNNFKSVNPELLFFNKANVWVERFCQKILEDLGWDAISESLRGAALAKKFSIEINFEGKLHVHSTRDGSHHPSQLSKKINFLFPFRFIQKKEEMGALLCEA